MGIINKLIKMGGNESTPVVRKEPKFNRLNYEIVCSKVEAHIALERDRKIEQLMKAEGKLKEMLMPDADRLQKDNILSQATDALTILKYVKGSNIVLRNIKLLKE